MPLTKAEHAAALKRMRRYPKGVDVESWGTGPLRRLEVSRIAEATSLTMLAKYG